MNFLKGDQTKPLRTTSKSVFSHDVTTAILVSQNNETAAMLVSQTSPVGVELFFYVNALFCPNNAGHVSENTILLL